MVNVKGELQVASTLAIQINPSPHITHRFRVIKNLRLADDFAAGLEKNVWKALLDHFDSDDSVGLQRGVFYIADDAIEVDRLEAAALLRFLPDYFTPIDPLTEALAKAIKEGRWTS